jgi:hypothetical protein
MNYSIFWDVAPCSPYVSRSFRGTHHLHNETSKKAACSKWLGKLCRFDGDDDRQIMNWKECEK